MVPRFLLAVMLAAPHGRAERLPSEQIAAAVVVETIAIPSPSEFLIAVDKQCEPNWAKHSRPASPAGTPDREHLAAQLGVIYADCHIAIEAGDAQSIRNSVRDLSAIAKKLNIGADTVARVRSIDDFAAAAEWNSLREELDAMRNDLRLAMLAQRDDDLLVIASVGSFNRQIEVVSAILAEDWSPQRAVVLDLSPTAEHLVERLDGLPEKSRNSPFVAGLSAALARYHGIMGSWRRGQPKKEEVTEIASTANGISRSAFEEPRAKN